MAHKTVESKVCRSLEEFIGEACGLSVRSLDGFYMDATPSYRGQDPRRAAADDSSHVYDVKLMFAKKSSGYADYLAVHDIKDIRLDTEDEIHEWVKDTFGFISKKLYDYRIRSELSGDKLLVYSRRSDLYDILRR